MDVQRFKGRRKKTKDGTICNPSAVFTNFFFPFVIKLPNFAWSFVNSSTILNLVCDTMFFMPMRSVSKIFKASFSTAIITWSPKIFHIWMLLGFFSTLLFH